MKKIIHLVLLVAVAHVAVGCAVGPDRLESNPGQTADAITQAIENCMADGKSEEECQEELFASEEAAAEEASAESGESESDYECGPYPENGTIEEEQAYLDNCYGAAE